MCGLKLIQHKIETSLKNSGGELNKMQDKLEVNILKVTTEIKSS